jgi:hypothetical protein
MTVTASTNRLATLAIIRSAPIEFTSSQEFSTTEETEPDLSITSSLMVSFVAAAIALILVI